VNVLHGRCYAGSACRFVNGHNHRRIFHSNGFDYLE
jgi:hypothetical protein